MERRPGKVNKLTRKSVLVTILLAISGLTQADSTSASSTTAHHDLLLDDGPWINDIGTLLYSDLDGDGYFSGLSLSIDADSSYNHYEVYAVVDILDENNRAENLHTTRPFYVYGYSFADEYRIDIDLLQNYFPGIYDLNVTLVDAWSNRIVDQVSARDFSNLRSLPLESEDNQTFHHPVAERPIDAPNDDVRVREYAGSTGFGILLTLLSAYLFRVRRFDNRRNL